MTQIVVLEDDSFTRATLVTALKAEGFEVFPAASAAEALEHSDADAALLDLHLGAGPNGVDVGVELRRKNPSIGLVFLTSFEDPRLMKASLDELPAGSSYLVKRQVFETEQLSLALRASMRASEGGKTISSIPPQFSKLTSVQLETLRLIARGLSNSEIARQRDVSEKSIEQTIARIAKALGLPANATQNNRVNIARVYFRLTGGRE